MVQIVRSRIQQQNSYRQTKMLSMYDFIRKPGKKRWISPTLASSQSSLTGDISINQPQSHLQKGSILVIKHHLHRAVNLKSVLQKQTGEYFAPKDLTAVCTPLSYRDPFKSSCLLRNKKLPVASIQ